jgi:glutaminase
VVAARRLPPSPAVLSPSTEPSTDPSLQEVQALVDVLYERYRGLCDGEVATYIPELARMPPDTFAIALVSTGGQEFVAGEIEHPFTIQSISKPLTFGMAIEACGREEVLRHVSVEPSGDVFNAIELQNGSNRPFNPMVNTGAIAVTALLYHCYGDAALERILERLSLAAGRRLEVDQAVYQSERRTGHRNRAIAHLLLNFGLMDYDAEAALDLYFKQCAILVTCRDLATIAATLSNMGRNPVTGMSVYDVASVKDMLSIMFTCGMYDYSGQWAFRVGMPAKSGVGGGVMAVVNRQIGIATFSPRLDSHGNSCRGIEVCVELASRLGLHAFDCLNAGSSYLGTIL